MIDTQMTLTTVTAIDIHNASAAAEFVETCCLEIGQGFHGDTRFEDYVKLSEGELVWPRLFSDEDAKRLNDCMDKAFELLGDGEETGVHAVALRACDTCEKEGLWNRPTR